MARMIPPGSTLETDSLGERQLYHLLRDALDDEYTVIHSLEWLCEAARDLSGKAVTGEIDFLVLHPQFGVLAVEVKGGAHRVTSNQFVHIKTGQVTSPVRQIRNGSHGLARWLRESSPGSVLQIGYAVVFPHSDFDGQDLGCALIDRSVSPPGLIALDRNDLPRLGERVEEIMRYWKRSLKLPALGISRMETLLATLCPDVDGKLSWACRMQWDNRLWLLLTEEQREALAQVTTHARALITGWPGTGKTLILAEAARRLLAAEKRVLVLTFNSLLADHLRHQIGEQPALRASTWHSLCATFRAKDTHPPRDGENWLDAGCLDDLRRAAEAGELARFDAVLVDEGQAFRREWLEWLAQWQAQSPLLVFGDETQVFEFERSRMSLAELGAVLGVNPYVLTRPIRSPKAVLQRLIAVRPPQMQLTSPREFEPDTLQEPLCSSRDDLTRLLAELLQEGFQGSDIVLLSKMGWARGAAYEGVRFETLARFRGLEAPVVVVVGANNMSDTELFCAYSRATTRCVALYDAEILGVRGPRSQFEHTLLAEPSKAAIAETARLAAQTSEIVRASLAVQWLSTATVAIGWSPMWSGWLVELRDDVAKFWVDWLALSTGVPVYFWEAKAIRSVSAVVRSSTPNETEVRGSHEVALCGVCGIPTPHRVQRDLNKVCGLLHSHELDGEDGKAWPDPGDMRFIEELDALIARDPKQLTPDERCRLPICLAAASAWRYAQQNARRVETSPACPTSGRPLYRAAFALVWATASLAKEDVRLSLKDSTQQWYTRYRMPDGLSIEQWHRDVAAAFNVVCGKGLLRKLRPGIYVPIGGGHG